MARAGTSTAALPSRRMRSTVRTSMVGVNVVAADTDAEARRLFTSPQQQWVEPVARRAGLLPPPVDEHGGAGRPQEEAQICPYAHATRSWARRTHRARGLEAFIDATAADEMILAAQIFDHAARLRSLHHRRGGTRRAEQMNGHELCARRDQEDFHEKGPGAGVHVCGSSVCVTTDCRRAVPIHTAPQQNTEMRFRAMDRNNDGVITRAEWRGTAQSFAEHDWNRDGVLSGDEVRIGVPRSTRRARRRRLRHRVRSLLQLDGRATSRPSIAIVTAASRRASGTTTIESFNRVDRNRDGFLTRAEFLGTSTVDDDRDDRFEYLDVDNNGRVERREWHGTGETFNWLDRNNDDILIARRVVGAPAATSTTGCGQRSVFASRLERQRPLESERVAMVAPQLRPARSATATASSRATSSTQRPAARRPAAGRAAGCDLGPDRPRRAEAALDRYRASTCWPAIGSPSTPKARWS